jgi:type 1 fimbria pilin
MKKNLLQLTALSSLLLSAAALASESAEVKVIGEISSVNCEVSVSNNGVFDFDKIKQSSVTDAITTIGRVEGGVVRVKCSAPTPLTFTATDNRADSAYGGNILGTNFGLGLVNKTGKLGYYQLRFTQPTVDGVATSMFATDDGEVNSVTGLLMAQQGRRMGWAASASDGVAIGKDFKFGMNATAYMAPKSAMNGALTEDVTLDGSTTLEFGFGL